MATAKEAGIYLAVMLDLDPLKESTKQLDLNLKSAGKELSSTLNNAIDLNQASKKIKSFSDSIVALTRTPKTLNFTPTIEGLDVVAQKAGLSKQSLDALYGAMAMSWSPKFGQVC